MAVLSVVGEGFLTTIPEGSVEIIRNGPSTGNYITSTYRFRWSGTDLTYDDQYRVPVGGTLTNLSLTLKGQFAPVWEGTGSVTMTPSLAIDPWKVPFAMADADDEWNNTYLGSPEDDTLPLRVFMGTVDAGAGEDTVEIWGAKSTDHSFSDINPNTSSVTVTPPSGSYSHRFNSVENFSFWDRTIAFSEIVSLYGPVYELVADTASVDEGSVAWFTLNTTNIESGTLVNLLLSGITTSDISGELLNINSIVYDGSAKIFVPISADGITEGSEILTVTVGDVSSSITINDTSLEPPNTESSAVTIIVDQGIAGDRPLLLDNLTEKITSSGSDVISHTLTYNGIDYAYEEIDQSIAIVLRNGDFTAEFRDEISDLSENMPAISYQQLISLVGQSSIETTILNIAGADGYFVS